MYEFQKCLYLCAILSFLSSLHLSSAISCDTIPISLSTVHTCNGKTCSYTELANVVIPNLLGAETCFQFISPDGSMDAFTINATIISTTFEYVPDYCYYTGSVQVDSKGWCGCPAGTPGVCPNCHAHSQLPDSHICTEGLHTDNYCIADWIGGHGTWCVDTSFHAEERYKICHYPETFSINIEILFSHANNTWVDVFDGISHVTHDTSNVVNVTIIEQTSIPTLNFDFTLFDKQSMEDFYFFTSSEVNALQESNTQKIGWYKADQEPYIYGDISSQISAKLQDCDSNEFSITYPWTRIEDDLHQQVSKLSSRIAPNSILRDTEFQPPPSSGIPTHIGHIYDQIIKDGWFGIRGGELAIIGLTPEDAQYGTSFCISAWTVSKPTQALLSDGYIHNITNGLCCTAEFDAIGGPPFYWRFELCMITEMDGDVLDINQGRLWSVCFEDFDGGDYIWKCGDDWNVTVLQWPTNKIQTIWWDGTFRSEIEPTVGITSNKAVYIPPTNGNLEFTVSFHHLNITFESTTISPVIDNVIQQGDKVIIEAHSATTSGLCYMATTPPGLLTAQEIVISPQKSNSTFFYAFGSYDGPATFRITCHQNIVEKESVVRYNVEVNTTEEVTDLISDSASDSWNPLHYGDLWSELLDGDLHGWGIAAFVIFTIIIIIIIIIIGFVLLTILPYAMPIITTTMMVVKMPMKGASYLFKKKNPRVR